MTKMKRIFLFIFAVMMIFTVFTSCGKSPDETTGSSGTTGTQSSETTTDKPAEPPVKMNAAQTLLSEFKRLVKENPDADSMDIAQLLCNHDYLTDMDLDVYTLPRPTGYEPFVIGMKEDFKVPDYVEMTDIIPQMTPNPFVAHIFELKEGTDAENFANLLKENADLAFNVCVVATECEAGYEGKFVFVVICTEDIVKTPDQVDRSSARYIMKNLVKTVGKGTSMMTVDTDSERSSYYFGLEKSLSLVEKTGAVCEPSMLGGSSIVIVKVKDANDAGAVADEMLAGLDTGKWICVIADAKKTAYRGEYVIGVMGSESYCDEVIAAFNALFDGTK